MCTANILLTQKKVDCGLFVELFKRVVWGINIKVLKQENNVS